MPPVCVFITDLSACDADWPAAMAQVAALQEPLASKLGFVPHLRLASLPRAQPTRRESPPADGALGDHLTEVLTTEAQANRGEIFVLPTMLDFGLVQKAQLAEIITSLRHQFHEPSLVYDDVDPCHPLLVQAFMERIYQRLASTPVTPQQLGLLLMASGEGDSDGRAQSYRLMRLLWDELGCARAEVGFLRQAQPLLHEQLDRCAREGLTWVLVPQRWWRHTSDEDGQARCEAFGNTHPEARQWLMLDPIGVSAVPHQRDSATAHLSVWLQQRLMALWQAKRAQRAVLQAPSVKRGPRPRINRLRGPEASAPLVDLPEPAGAALYYGAGGIAEIYDQEGLAQLLRYLWAPAPSPQPQGAVMPDAPRPWEPPVPPRHIFIKVTWHGYAPGTYTDPVALDALLSALPGQAVLLEGHTSSRNLGGATWDWATESQHHRGWIAEQEAEYLQRTGLTEVMRKHQARYINVTEAWWDGQCAPQETVKALLAAAGVQLHFPALAAFVPEVLLAHRGAPFLSFARFKGPTRLSLTNLFGLLPPVLRTAWHGPDIMHFARVCCDLARLYGCLFPLYGMVEGLHVAVRWERQGLYRSRWGNYDLIPHPGLVTFSRGLPLADVLASRLQGRDVQRSAFFQVMRQELGFPEALAQMPIPADLVLRLV